MSKQAWVPLRLPPACGTPGRELQPPGWRRCRDGPFCAPPSVLGLKRCTGQQTPHNDRAAKPTTERVIDGTCHEGTRYHAERARRQPRAVARWPDHGGVIEHPAALPHGNQHQSRGKEHEAHCH